MRQFVITERITTKGQKALELYKQDVSKIPMLTPQQEYEYAVKAQQGDEEAVQKLVESNLRFVISVAKMYSRDSATIEDLIQVGNIGLVDSARKFDPSKGFKFISYAVWHIRKEMIKYMGDLSRTVRIPQNKGQLASKIKQAHSQLYSELGREPTNLELIDLVKEITPLASTLDEDMLIVIMNSDPKASSLDAQLDVGDSGSMSRLDMLDSGRLDVDKQMYSDHQKEVLERLMSVLGPYDQNLVRDHFGMNELGFERTTASIAFEMDQSPETVRLRLKKAIKKMKVEARRLGIDTRDLMS